MMERKKSHDGKSGTQYILKGGLGVIRHDGIPSPRQNFNPCIEPISWQIDLTEIKGAQKELGVCFLWNDFYFQEGERKQMSQLVGLLQLTGNHQ